MIPLISVIVPVYNKEQWLSECIDSIREQTYSNLEIILVDDGSGENAAKYCDICAEQDIRIKVYHEDNGGVSKARNVGLEYATGQYIVFVDADDFLDRDVLRRALDFQMSNPMYLCRWNYASLHADGTKVINLLKFTREMDVIRWKASIIGGDYGANVGCLVRTVWGCMLSASIIRERHIRFVEGLYIGEDAVFLIEYMSSVKGVLFMDYVGYFYRIHSSSAARRYKADLFSQFATQLDGLVEGLLQKECKHEVIVEAVANFIWSGFNELIHNNRKGWKQGLVPRQIIFEEPLVWYQQNQERIGQGKRLSRTAGNFIFLERVLSFFLPVNIICRLAGWHDALRDG